MQLNASTRVVRIDRRGWLALAAVMLAFGVWLGVARDAGVWPLFAFGAMPDLALFLGMGSRLAKGQLHPRAVPFYNALHSLLGPAALAVATTAVGGSSLWFVAALAWATHIAIDRAVGYGMRDRNGFQRG
jgi:hypothetical protein